MCDIDDIIDEFVGALEFDQLKHWAKLLNVDYEEPPLDDMYPDWEGEIRAGIAEEMLKVGK